MRPTSRMLIDSIAEALDQMVLPAIGDDKWAASTVRSAVSLLEHLSRRVELEASTLAADNDDARAVLGNALTLMRQGDDRALRSDIETELADTLETPLDVPATDARNTRYQALLDRLLRDQYDGAWTDAHAQPLRGAVRAYLQRRLRRERDIYFPAFTGPPF